MFVLLCLGVFVIPFLVFSAPSEVMHYQGKLTDTSNVPVSDGSYDFKITLWDALSGGNCLWSARGTCGTPTTKSLSTVDGVFSTVLGEVGDNAFSLDFNSDYYLQIQVESDSPMTPRRRVSASAYALNSLRLNGQNASYYLDTSSSDQIKSGGLTVYGNTVFGDATSDYVSLYGGNTSGDIRTTSGNALTLTPASGQNLNINLATTGDFAVNTDDLYVDTSSGYVGIGTASPVSRLDVVGGNINVSNASSHAGLVATSASGFNSFIDFNEGGTKSSNIYFGGSNNTFYINDGSVPSGVNIALATNTNGNVGIGTASPSAKLHVLETTEQLRLGYDTSNYLSTTVGSSGIVTLNAVGSGQSFTISDPINVTGNSSITGTLGSLTGLTSSGNITFSGVSNDGSEATALLINGSNQLVYRELGSNAFSSTGFANTALSNLASVAINTSLLPASDDSIDLGDNTHRWRDLYLGGETLHIGTSTTDEATLAYNTTTNILGIGTDSTTNGDIAFFTDDLYLDKSTGYVGVGTTSPSAQLDVYATAGSNPAFRLSDADVTLPSYSSVGFSPSLGTNTILNVSSYSGSTGGIQLVGFTSSGTNNGTPVAIVGYHGGTSPSTAAINLVGYKWDGGTNRAALASSELVLQVSNAIGTPKVTVLGSGNVGIGTTSPGKLLDVYGSIGGMSGNFQVIDQAAGVPQGNGSNRLDIGNLALQGSWPSVYFNGYYNGTNNKYITTDSTFLIQHDSTNDWLVFAGAASGTAGSNITYQADMIIDTSGNVGIGAVSAGSRLYVSNSVTSASNPLFQATDSSATNSYIKISDGTSVSGQFMPILEARGVGTGQVDRTGLIISALLSEDGSDDWGTRFIAKSDAGAALANAPTFAWFNSTTEQMRLSASGNLGIGTTSPSEKLQVFTNSDAWGISTGDATGAGKSILKISGTASGNNGYGLIQQFANGGYGNLVFQRDGGSVGIGTASPTALETYSRLTVEGTDNTALASAIINDGTGQASFYLRRTAGTAARWGMYVPSGSTDLRFYAGSSGGVGDAVTIQNGGNVGIGTASPSAKLVVTSSGSTDPVHIHSPSQSPWAMRIFNDTYSSSTPVFDFYPQNDGSFLMGTNVATSLKFYTNSYSNTRMTILGTGNVGIGTTNPAAALHVYKSGVSADGNAQALFGTASAVTQSNALGATLEKIEIGGATVQSSDSGFAGLALSTNQTGTNNAIGSLWFVNSGLGVAEKRLAQIGANTDGATNSGNLRFATNNAGTFSTKMTIASDGSVGIGTTSPSEILHVVKDAVAGSYLRMDSVNGAPGIQTYRANGSVASPTAVVNDDYIGLWSMRGYDTDYNIYASAYISGRASQNWSATANGTYLSFATTPNNSITSAVRMTIDNAGNVGIGTTSPQGALHVVGANVGSATVAGTSMGMSGNYASLELKGTSSSLGGGFIDFGYASNDFRGRIFYENVDDFMNFYTSGSERMRIKNDGNVGIGTTSPGALFDVQGAAQFGSGDVNLIGSTGKIAGLSTTYFSTDSSSNLSGILTDETGSGVFVLGTSPSFTTSIVTGSSSFDLVNTNATTLNIGGAATALNLAGGSGSTGCTIDGSGNFSCSGTVSVSGYANTALSNLASVAINTSLLPASDDSIDLGDNTHRFRDLYLGGDTLHLGTSTTDEATLAYNTTSNILNIGTDSTTNGDIAFFTNNLYLDKSTGYVGVGTTSPSGKLSVSNNTTDPALQVTQSGTGYLASFVDGSDEVLRIEDGGNIVVGDKTVASSSWAVSYDGSQESMLTLAVYNSKLYAGMGTGSGDGDILVFDGSSWTTSYDGSGEYVLSLAVYDGKLYAGLGGTGSGDGDVYVFDGSSWTQSYDGSTERVQSLAVYDGKLYAGVGDNNSITGTGDVYAFDGASWTLSYNSSSLGLIESLAVYDGKLYAGGGNASGSGDGDVVVYDGSSWTTSYNGSQEEIYTLTVYNGKLYAGQGWSAAGDGDILVFDGSSWTTSYDGSQENIYGLGVYNGKLYAGQGSGTGDGDILVFDGSSWTTSYDGSQERMYGFAEYNGKFYNGQGNGTGDGDVLVMTEAQNSSYPIRFAIGSGASQKVGALWFSSEDLYGTSGGPGSNVGVFKMSHSLITTAGAYDIAEDYPTSDGSLRAGMVVAVDSEQDGHVVSATQNDTVIGIVSTYPGFRLSGSGFTERSVPVALSGRAPVLVTGEGGDIHRGDTIVLSSTQSGYAAKGSGTISEAVVGYALQEWSPKDSDDVSAVEVSLHVRNSASFVASDTVSYSNDMLDALKAQVDIVKEENKTLMSFYESLNLGSVVLADEKGNIDIFGNLNVQDIFAKNIDADSVSTSSLLMKNEEGYETIGTAEIPEGEIKIHIKTKVVKPESRIFVTISDSSKAVPLRVSSKETQSGFVVEMNEPQTGSVRFDWWIVNQPK